MKEKKFLITDLCFILLFAILIFATWNVMSRHSGAFLHLFDSNSNESAGNCNSTGGGLILLSILIAVCGGMVAISFFVWFLFSVICLIFVIIGFIKLFTHKDIKRLNNLLKIYTGFAIIVVLSAFSFIYATIKVAPYDKNFNVTVTLILLSITIAVGTISTIINFFALKENKSLQNINLHN